MRKARTPKREAHKAKTLRGIKAKRYNKQRFTEKVQMKKTIKAYEEKQARQMQQKNITKQARYIIKYHSYINRNYPGIQQLESNINKPEATKKKYTNHYNNEYYTYP